jgi:tRNA(Ile2) C34 agmatinyltransferase TiaS
MNLLTRKQVIDLWLKNKQHLNSYCCPNCRDILISEGNHKYKCKNSECANCDLVVSDREEYSEIEIANALRDGFGL